MKSIKLTNKQLDFKESNINNLLIYLWRNNFIK